MWGVVVLIGRSVGSGRLRSVGWLVIEVVLAMALALLTVA